ncbi:MAG: hypothetical protein Q8N26_09420 [Myxococcales bacterium]|nr:hypothetical protein [Myxococcales bacterium]
MRPFFVASVVFVLSSACGGVMPPCDSRSCAGCCDVSGLCQPGSVDSACGQGGLQCRACGAGASCVTQQCLTPSGSGGGTAGGVAGGGSAGGMSAAGGAATGGGMAGGSATGGGMAGGSATGGGMAGGSATSGGAAGGAAGGGSGGGMACTMPGVACSSATQCCATNSDCGITTTSPNTRICCGKQGSSCSLGSCCAPSICRTISGSIRVCQ